MNESISMSNESNDKLWDRTISHLKQLVQEEEANNDAAGDEYTHYAKLYIRYTLVLADMDKVYNSCVQAQKRIDMQITMEHIICRVIRLRNCLAKLPPPTQSSCEWLDLSSALTELKISPSQLEVLTPFMFKEDNESVSTRITKMGSAISSSSSTLDEGLPDPDSNSSATLCSDEDDQDASTIAQPKADLDAEKKENIVNGIDGKHAASKIQALYRGTSARRRVAKERIELDNFIGMSNSSKGHEIGQLDADLAQIRKQRIQEQSQCKQSYEAELRQLKDAVLEEEGFAMQMELREERIRWITEQTVTKHVLPDSLEEFYSKDAEGKESKQDDASTKKELMSLKECIDLYGQRWKGRVVGPDRIKSQAVDSEMAKDLIVRNQVRADLTPGIDGKLLSNLQKIKATQDGDKKSKKKEKPTKGKKASKKKGGKKEKPLPGTKLPEIKDMQVQEMLEFLVQNGFIHEHHDHKISNFIGPFEATGIGFDAPNAWELRMAVMDSCILPMGTNQIRACIQDESIRSILL